jgi:hypothetical protein
MGMPLIRNLALLLCLVSTSGCYFYFSPPNNRARPTVIPGAEIEIKSSEVTQRTESNERDTREICATGTDTYEFTKYTATYGGKKLTEGELLALVSPRYNADWDRIESKKGVCRLSLVPTVLSGIALAVGGGLSIYGGLKYGKIEEWDSKTRNATYVATGATVGFGLLSYVAGGFACITANGIGIAMGAKYHHNREFHVGNRNQHWTEARIEELEKVVRAFNAKAKGGGAVAPAEDE